MRDFSPEAAQRSGFFAANQHIAGLGKTYSIFYSSVGRGIEELQRAVVASDFLAVCECDDEFCKRNGELGAACTRTYAAYRTLFDLNVNTVHFSKMFFDLTNGFNESRRPEVLGHELSHLYLDTTDATPLLTPLKQLHKDAYFFGGLSGYPISRLHELLDAIGTEANLAIESDRPFFK